MDTKGSRSGYGRLPAEKAHELRSARKATARATRAKSPATFFCLLVACLTCCSNTAPKAGTALVALDASWAIHARLQDPLLAWTAQDIQDKLSRISGQRLPILKPAGVTPATGRPVLRLEVLEPADTTLGRDGFRIRVKPESVRVQANSALGVSFGAMELLERLGCRWYAPGAYHIPRNRPLRLAAGTTCSVPAFPLRRIRSSSAANPEWCLRNRLNCGYTFPPGTEPHAYFLDGCHSFSRLVPPVLFPEHPELFSQVAGTRRAGSQLCLSNPEVAEHVRCAVAETFRKARARDVAAHVAQNDNLWWCECSRCTALAARYGGRSGALLHFLNPLARWASREFPGKRIATLAYMYTQSPPRGVEPDPNLVVRFCNYRPHCQIHPLASCPTNRTNYRDAQGWSRPARHLHVYEYMINFHLFPLPCPNLEAMSENIRLYRSLGVEGVYYSGTPSPGAWMTELKSYLAARSLWDPDEDPDRAEKEFLADVKSLGLTPDLPSSLLPGGSVRCQTHSMVIFSVV